MSSAIFWKNVDVVRPQPGHAETDRKSTRLNSSHSQISYAVFCLKKKKTTQHSLSLSIHSADSLFTPSILPSFTPFARHLTSPCGIYTPSRTSHCTHSIRCSALH